MFLVNNAGSQARTTLSQRRIEAQHHNIQDGPEVSLNGYLAVLQNQPKSDFGNALLRLASEAHKNARVCLFAASQYARFTLN
jgi:hypothetical protein